MRVIFTALAVLLISWSAKAEKPEHFIVDTAEDLAQLCSAKPESETYAAAIHFCHGFASGAYHYYKVEALSNPAKEFICFKEPMPTRTSVLNDFVGWLHENPQYKSNEAVDVLFRYLGETYPCKN
ncbi:MAG: hypothetical protein KIT00_09495 [Rhodospirillales bacterium]|nr:hypothetical protein [Rhodospirillales bacterium]